MKRERILDPSDVFKSASHWRMRAEEMRTIAKDSRSDAKSNDAQNRGGL